MRQPLPGGLRRALSARMLVVFIVGDMLGAGIYVLLGQVSGVVGGAIWLPFLVALLLAVLTAGSYAELVTRYPHAAGSAYYAKLAFGSPFVTFMVGFAVVASGISSAATLSLAFAGDYLAEIVSLPAVPIALGFIALLAAINLRGVTESVRFNVVLTALEVLGLGIIIAIGVSGLVDGSADLSRNLDFDSHGDGTAMALMAGVALAFYALIGFEDSVHLAEETIDPARAYPRALLGGLVIAGAIYMAVTVAVSAVVPTEELAGSTAPLVEVVRSSPVDLPPGLFSVVALIAVSNGALINMLMASRLVYGLAREGSVSARLAQLLPGRRTPAPAILLTTAAAMCLIATGDLGELADTTVVLILLVFTAVNMSALVLRRSAVQAPGFRFPAVVPGMGILVSLALVARSDADVLLRAGVLLGLGAAAWMAGRVASRAGGHAQ